MINRLTKQCCKFLVIEDLQTAAWWNFADSCGMETMMIVTVATLYKNTTVTQTFSKNFATNIVQVDT